LINAIRINVDFHGEGNVKNKIYSIKILLKLTYIFRYALDKLEQNKPESEDEICACSDSVQTDDSDDEWNSISVKYCI
jgi:hypothetical protein